MLLVQQKPKSLGSLAFETQVDLLADLRLKVDALRGQAASTGLEAVLRHIEIAERRLRQGVSERDGDYFNDAVYRSNQAYEGILKEACEVIVAGSMSLRTFELEDRLLSSKVITPRAKKLLESYRQEWRNPATHSHTLFFGEQDAFLAIVMVLALVSVITDQVVESLAARDQQRDLETSPPPESAVDEALSVRVPKLIQEYSRRPHAFFREDGEPRSVNELIGRIGAFLRGAEPGLLFRREPVLGSGLRPDLVISNGDDQLVVEIKRIVSPAGLSPGVLGQLLEYLQALKVRHGLLLIPPSAPDRELDGHVDVFKTPEGDFYWAIVLRERDESENEAA